MVPFFQPFLEAKQGRRRRFPLAITAYIKVHAYLAIPSSRLETTNGWKLQMSRFFYHKNEDVMY
jgi:carbohydrate-selective porin OprB